MFLVGFRAWRNRFKIVVHFFILGRATVVASVGWMAREYPHSIDVLDTPRRIELAQKFNTDIVPYWMTTYSWNRCAYHSASQDGEYHVKVYRMSMTRVPRSNAALQACLMICVNMIKYGTWGHTLSRRTGGDVVEIMPQRLICADSKLGK